MKEILFVFPSLGKGFSKTSEQLQSDGNIGKAIIP